MKSYIVSDFLTPSMLMMKGIWVGVAFWSGGEGDAEGGSLDTPRTELPGVGCD